MLKISRELIANSCKLACGNTVNNLWKSLLKQTGLCPVSTICRKYLTSKVLFVGEFSTGYALTNNLFAQLKIANFNLLSLSLYPVSTGPITNTNLIYKELHS
jgi:hypothetical protein